MVLVLSKANFIHLQLVSFQLTISGVP